MKNFNKFICISITISAIVMTSVQGYTYTNCDVSQLKGSVNWVNVSNCDPSLLEKCIFKKGTNATITASFITHEDVNSLKVKIYGVVLGLSVPWRITPDDVCSYGTNCPIVRNTDNLFSLSMPISPAYPNIPVTVKIRFEDNRRKPHFCITFPAKIED